MPPLSEFDGRVGSKLEQAVPNAGRSRTTETIKTAFASDMSAGDAIQQPWFSPNYSLSPYGMPSYSSLFAYSPSFQPTPQPTFAAYQSHSDSNISSSSSEGSSFSSPSYSDPTPLPNLGYPFPSISRSRSPPPQMAIDMSLIDGGVGYEDLVQFQSNRDPSGFTGFFAGNGDGLKGRAVEAAGIPVSNDSHLDRQPTFAPRRASSASSDASYESYESEAEPMVAIDFGCAALPSSRKRSRSPQMPELSRPVGRTSISVASPPARKRSKVSPTIPLAPSNPVEHDLPPLPADFDTYGPGGSSLFDDSLTAATSRSARATTPDFSGRDDCWGIGQEAYARLSAKAKKQLRNKIGARRFRERRKEYITTLEGKLHERDEVISAYRGRLEGALDEVAQLKLRIAQLEKSRS